MGEFGGLRPDLSAEQGRLDELATAAGGAGVQRREDARHQVQRRDVVGDEDAHGGGWILVTPGGRDESTGRLSREVGAFPVVVGSHRAEGAPLGADDAGVHLGQVVVAESPRLERARFEVADEDVGVPGERFEDLGAARMAQIQGDAALAPVAGDVHGAARILGADVDVPTLVAEARQLDLDDVRAHVGEHGRRLRALDEETGFENAYAVERSRQLEIPAGAISRPTARRRPAGERVR